MLAQALASGTMSYPIGRADARRERRREHWSAREPTAVARPQWNLSLRIVGWRGLSARRSTSAVVIGRNLGLDTASIGCCADLGEDGANSLHKAVLELGSREVQGRLDNVVCKRVLQASLNVSENLRDNHVLGRRLSAA